MLDVQFAVAVVVVVMTMVDTHRLLRLVRWFVVARCAIDRLLQDQNKSPRAVAVVMSITIAMIDKHRLLRVLSRTTMAHKETYTDVAALPLDVAPFDVLVDSDADVGIVVPYSLFQSTALVRVSIKIDTVACMSNKCSSGSTHR